MYRDEIFHINFVNFQSSLENFVGKTDLLNQPSTAQGSCVIDMIERSPIHCIDRHLGVFNDKLIDNLRFFYSSIAKGVKSKTTK